MKAKNIISLILPIVLCVVFIIVPVFELVGLLKGLDFQLYAERAMVIIQAVLALGSMIALLIMRPEYGNTGKIFLMLALPVSLLNALCFTNSEWALSILFAVVWCVCVFVLYYKFVPDSGFKAFSAVVSVLTAVAVVVLYLWSIIYGSFVHKFTVTESVGSMNGTYIAELGTDDSLFGTSAAVYVKKAEPEIDTFMGYYTSDPMLAYEGEDYEIKTIILSWLDDETLIINDAEYKVIVE